MSIYLAGPMRGYTLYNFPTFITVANLLRAYGWEVLNPAEMDLAEGIDPFNHSVEFCIRDAMARDTAAVCKAEAIALLPGWERSRGVYVEVVLGMVLGLWLYEITNVDDALQRLEFRSLTYKEVHERTRSMREPRDVPQVREPEQPRSILGRLRQVFQRGLQILGIFTLHVLPL